MADDTTATRSAVAAGGRDSAPASCAAGSCSSCTSTASSGSNADVNAVVTLDADRARAAADAADAALARGDERRPAARAPGHDQGRDRDRGDPFDRWRGRADRPRARARRARGGAPEGRGRDRVRQDQPAALVGRLPDLQRHLRRHEQPVGRSTAPSVVRRAARRPRSPPGSPASSSAPTSAARCASRRTAAACSGSSRASAWSRSAATSTTSAAAPPTPTSTCSVPIARSADDLELLLGVLAGPEPERAAAWRLELPRERRDALADFRVGTWLDDPASPVDARVPRACCAPRPIASPTPAPRSTTTHPPVDFARAARPVRPHDRAGDLAEPRPTSRRPTRRRGRTARGCAPKRSAPALRRAWAEWFERPRPAAAARC